jgi:hypothetical protein
MLPIQFQKEDSRTRKARVIEIATAFSNLDISMFPNIYAQIKSGNNKKVAVLNRVIEQMYLLDFNLHNSLLAIEDNI